MQIHTTLSPDKKVIGDQDADDGAIEFEDFMFQDEMFDPLHKDTTPKIQKQVVYVFVG